MLGVLKKVYSLCVRIMLFLLQAIRPRSPPTPVESNRVGELSVSSGEGSWEEPGWASDGWEEFSVKVIPNSLEEEETVNCGEEDLFKDMVPVFKRTKKINLEQASGSNREEQVNLNKFAVQNTFQNEDGGLGELGVWSEEGVDAWEEELIPAEGELVQSSLASVKEKRRAEREKRRAAQELLRSQQKTASRQVQLGTRVS